MSTWTGLGREPFVSLTTYRRSGEGVATAVWVAADGDDLLVWTPAQSWKVTRLRNDPRADLAPCGRRGAVAADAPHAAATAVVVDDPASLQRATSLLRAKYGFEYRAVSTLERLVGTLRRRPTARVVLRLRPLA